MWGSMHETEADMRKLQEHMDLSIRQAGPFLRKAFQLPHRSLNAQQIVRHFHGLHTVAFATSTSQGVPRVSPVLAILYRGEFYIPTVKNALRTRHVLQRPEVSLTGYLGNEFAIIVHGKAEVVEQADEQYSILEELHRSYADESASDWGTGVYLRIDPLQVFTYAKDPSVYPEFARKR